MKCRPLSRTEIRIRMPKNKVVNGTYIVAFRRAMEKYAQPTIFTCSANEADAIQELLDRVCNEGSGPIGTLRNTEFVEQVKPTTLAELQYRFADELAELEAEEEEEEAAEKLEAGAVDCAHPDCPVRGCVL
jgi:hypothetical protein